MSSPLAHLYDVDLEEDLASIVPPVSDTEALRDMVLKIYKARRSPWGQ